MDWVEVQARSVEAAVEVALQELGLASAEEAEVEVLQQPQRGFLGMGGQDAVVRVRRAAPKRSGRRGRGRRGGGRRGKKEQEAAAKQPDTGQGGGRRAGKGDGGGRERRPSDGRGKGGNGKQRKGDEARSADRPRGDGGGKGRREPPKRRGERPGNANKSKAKAAAGNEQPAKEEAPPVDIGQQAQVVEEFLRGLIDAFGLEGTVASEIDEDIIKVTVLGEQTEALVGPKGVIMQAIHELLRIVVQRKTHHRARIRLDIAGYGERRREALVIYSQRLSEQIRDQGGEVMLEPMNPADRKVVHDAVAEIEGVRSWSEGEEPNRSVILGLAPGVDPRGSAAGVGEDQGGEGEPGDDREDGAPGDSEDGAPGDSEDGAPGDSEDGAPGDDGDDDEE